MEEKKKVTKTSAKKVTKKTNKTAKKPVSTKKTDTKVKEVKNKIADKVEKLEEKTVKKAEKVIDKVEPKVEAVKKEETKDVNIDNAKTKTVIIALVAVLALLLAFIIYRLAFNSSDDRYKDTIVKYCDTYKKEFKDNIKSKYLIFLREIESFSKDENFKDFECEISKPVEVNKNEVSTLNKKYSLNSDKMYKYKITLRFKDNHKEVDSRNVLVAKNGKDWKVYKEST